MSGAARACPICERPLRAEAELATGEGALFVGDCGVCGRYALGPAELRLAVAMGPADRMNLMARLETRAIGAEADGTVLLRPVHFKKGAG